VTSSLVAALAALSGACIGAVEAPLFTWALAGTYSSFLAVCWLLPLLPWQLVADRLSWLLPGCLRPLAQAHAGLLFCLSLAVGCLLARGLARAGRCCTPEDLEEDGGLSDLSEPEIFQRVGARGLDELEPGSLSPL